MLSPDHQLAAMLEGAQAYLLPCAGCGQWLPDEELYSHRNLLWCGGCFDAEVQADKDQAVADWWDRLAKEG